MEECRFHIGDVVQHFKRENVNLETAEYLYRILAFAQHTENGEKLVQRILSNRHIDLPDFSYAAPKSVAVATATPHSSALHMKKSSCANIIDT